MLAMCVPSLTEMAAAGMVGVSRIAERRDFAPKPIIRKVDGLLPAQPRHRPGKARWGTRPICYLRSLIELMILLARPYSIASEADIQ